MRPARATRGFRAGQVISGGLLALAHGTNDAQKTMGVITLALVANGTIAANDFHVPTWVVASAATAIALGTYVGGWRIIKTMGSRIHKMDSAQGFAAQGSGAAVILASSHVGFPLSTTQTISGAVIGSGAAKRLSAVRWGVAGNIVAAWVITLPASAAIGALTYGVTSLFGDGRPRPDRGVRADTRRGSSAADPSCAAGAAHVRRRPSHDARVHRRRRRCWRWCGPLRWRASWSPSPMERLCWASTGRSSSAARGARSRRASTASLAVLAGLVVAAALVFAIVVMVDK